MAHKFYLSPAVEYRPLRGTFAAARRLCRLGLCLSEPFG
jgi:hypothetical protein